jgi:hypothetical protein
VARGSGRRYSRRGEILLPPLAATLMKNYIVLVLAVIAVILLGEFVFQFADWNKTQTCATSGGRNCGGPRIMLNP